MQTQNNNQTYTDQGFRDIQTGCMGNSAWGTELNSAQQLWYFGIQQRILFGLILLLWELCITNL